MKEKSHHGYNQNHRDEHQDSVITRGSDKSPTQTNNFISRKYSQSGEIKQIRYGEKSRIDKYHGDNSRHGEAAYLKIGNSNVKASSKDPSLKS